MRHKPLNNQKILKGLLWAFLLLLLFEGALRKWVFPSLATPLLIVRDPITLLIYFIALQSKCFPSRNNFVAGAIILAIFSFLFSLFSGQFNLWITLYGIRINYLYIPLIFIIPNVLDKEDIEQMGKFLVYCSFGMTIIMALQFISPQTAWINRKVGGIHALGITGAEGRFRPEGTFSFITGIAAFYPLVTVFLFNGLISKKIPILIIAMSAAATLIAITFSMSRLNAVSCGLVAIAGIYSLTRSGVRLTLVTQIIGIATLLTLLIPFTPFIKEGMSAFNRRWEISTGEGVQGFKENIADRYTDALINPILNVSQAPFLGEGIGTGSNVGAQMLIGKRGFLRGEGEWLKIIMELGIPLGLAYIIYRISLTWYLFRVSLRSLKKKNMLPLLLFSATAPLILAGQWGPPTILGFSILDAGFLLAATRVKQ